MAANVALGAAPTEQEFPAVISSGLPPHSQHPPDSDPGEALDRTAGAGDTNAEESCEGGRGILPSSAARRRRWSSAPGGLEAARTRGGFPPPAVSHAPGEASEAQHQDGDQEGHEARLQEGLRELRPLFRSWDDPSSSEGSPAHPPLAVADTQLEETCTASPHDDVMDVDEGVGEGAAGGEVGADGGQDELRGAA